MRESNTLDYFVDRVLGLHPACVQSTATTPPSRSRDAGARFLARLRYDCSGCFTRILPTPRALDRVSTFNIIRQQLGTQLARPLGQLLRGYQSSTIWYVLPQPPTEHDECGSNPSTLAPRISAIRANASCISTTRDEFTPSH